MADFASGRRSGVRGTPTFFINGIRYDGPVERDALIATLARAALAPR
jgi:protein-disulfide isomerase